MSVKAKFVCSSVTEFKHSIGVSLDAVYSSEGENADFTKFTPNGKFAMTIDKESPASDYFVPGECYYIVVDKITK